MLGNTYTNGSKGSGFDFELRVLKTLDMIAELVTAGGAVPGIQNLQSVTDINNTTTNSINVTSNTINISDSYLQVTSKGGTVFSNLWSDKLVASTVLGGGYQMNFPNTAIGCVHDLPQASGVYALSVNGATADAFGNISLNIPLYTGFATLTNGRYTATGIPIINGFNLITLTNWSLNGSTKMGIPCVEFLTPGDGFGIISRNPSSPASAVVEDVSVISWVVY